MSTPQREYRIAAGRYRLLQELGDGGMGRVWRAYDSEDREVAVKVIPRPRLGTALEKYRSRFRDEVEAGERLQCEHICKVMDNGESEEEPDIALSNGAFYIVMEYVSGGNLRDALSKGPISPDQIRMLARAMSVALQVAHTQRPVIVHRDIKPENILLPGGQFGKAKLADFGIARSEGGTRLTTTGYGVGTSKYMPPEQFIGSSHVGPSADQYSLALVLWESLTGYVPMDEGDPVLTMSVRREGAVLPALTLQGVTCRSVGQVFAKALHSSPDKRFASVDGFVRNLQEAGEVDGLWKANSGFPVLPSGWSVHADHRSKGGNLWLVAPGATHDDLERVFGTQVHWNLKRDSQAVGAGEAWWTQAEYSVLPRYESRNEAFPILQKQERSAKPHAAFLLPVVPSRALARIVGAEPLARTEITRKLWEYIQANNLQDPANRRSINADDNLFAIFGKPQVSMFEMTKLVSRHVTSV